MNIYILFSIILFFFISCSSEIESSETLNNISSPTTSELADETSMPAPWMNPEEPIEKIVSTGTFESIKAETSWEVVLTWNWDFFEVQITNFSTGRAPDLYVYISESEILNEDDIVNAREISELQSRTGDQNYALPNDFDVDEISSIAIYCKEYNELYAVAKVIKSFATNQDNDRLEYIWLTEQEAINLAGARGDIFRVVSIDGEPQMATMDYRPGRINASIIDGRVSEFYIEWDK